jgi:hypothetical protein
LVASSPAIAIVAAGATLANPGGFIPLALKEISELDPSGAEHAVAWIAFALVPLLAALVMLVVARERTVRALTGARDGWSVTQGRSPPCCSSRSQRRCCATGSPDSSIAEGARLPERTPADHLAGRRGRLRD